MLRTLLITLSLGLSALSAQANEVLHMKVLCRSVSDAVSFGSRIYQLGNEDRAIQGLDCGFANNLVARQVRSYTRKTSRGLVNVVEYALENGSIAYSGFPAHD
jgi:hypothetical protein